MVEFFREPTAEERKDFIPILYREKNAQTIFREKLESTELKFFRDKKPFCSRCAQIDFKDEWQKKIKEFERRAGYMKSTDLKVNDLNLDEYGNEDRFEFVGESDAKEPIGRPDFSRGMVERKVKIGVHRDYKCKVRNCGVSIFIPNEEIKEIKKK